MKLGSGLLLLGAPLALLVLLGKKKDEPGPIGPTTPASYPAMTPFLQSLPELHPSMSPVERAVVLRARNNVLLAEVERKQAAGGWTSEDMRWVDIYTSHGPYAAKIQVMADALQFDGVRVTTDFLTAQKIADVLGFYLPTPHVLNAINAQSGIKVAPATHPEWIDASHPKYDGTASYTKRMIDHSADVEARVNAALQGGPDSYPGQWKGQGGVEGLVNNAGKHWVNTPRNWEKGDDPATARGANHGWYRPDGGLWQNVGLAHTLDHVDYSQTFRAMGPVIEVTSSTGEVFSLPTDEALTSAEWSPLVLGAEGPMPLSRHPAIQPYGMV